jgi:hypothetical protein
MTASYLPTPQPDEKAILLIEILAPPVAVDSADFRAFDQRFADFKRAIDALISEKFSGALKMKVVMKKHHQFGSQW